MSGRGDEGRYVRAVELAWSRLRGRPTVLSPRDFEIVDGWRRRGIPLPVVLEVLDHRAKRRSSSGGRSLALVAPSVEEAWAAVAAGRTAVAIAPSNAADARGAATWADALQRLPDGAPLKRLLAHLLGEAASGIPTDTLDARLDEALPRLVPPEMAAHALRETELALAEFKTRMRPEEFEKTFARALADRLRDALYLPRLRSPR